MSGLSGLVDDYTYDESRIARVMKENEALRDQVGDALEELSEERVRVDELRKIIDRMIERMIEAGVG